MIHKGSTEWYLKMDAQITAVRREIHTTRLSMDRSYGIKFALMIVGICCPAVYLIKNMYESYQQIKPKK